MVVFVGDKSVSGRVEEGRFLGGVGGGSSEVMGYPCSRLVYELGRIYSRGTSSVARTGGGRADGEGELHSENMCHSGGEGGSC